MRRTVWRSALLALAAAAAASLGCEEAIVAPGDCPALCPSGEIVLADTVLAAPVVSDTSYRGGVVPHEATFLLVADRDSLTSLALLRFDSLPARFRPSATDTTTAPVTRADSVILSLTVQERDTTALGMQLVVYRLPARFDTSLGFADALPLFADSLVLDTIAVPDTLRRGTLRTRLDTALVRSALASEVGLGVRLRAAGRGSASLQSRQQTPEALATPTLRFYVRGGTAPDDTLQPAASFGIQAVGFNTFVYTPPPPAASGRILVGGLPSDRALLRLELPAFAVDSVRIVRATLILVPDAPATGRPGEEFQIEARPILADFGPKSLFSPDTLLRGVADVAAGSSGALSVEVGLVLRFWATTSGQSRPRVLLLRVPAEGSSFGRVLLRGRSAGADAPQLRVTYIRPSGLAVQ